MQELKINKICKKIKRLVVWTNLFLLLNNYITENLII